MTKAVLILKGIKIAVTIALIMFILAVCFSFINDMMFKGSYSLISSYNFFIGMLGYGSISTDSIVIHIIISFTGIVLVAFLTAYLTMNLFMRDKIYIFKRIVLWEVGTERFASFFIVNTGSEIAEVEVSFATFINKKVLRVSNNNENFTIPYMPKRGHWKIDIPIKPNTFINESLDKVNNLGWMLYLSVKYIDIFTGQKFTNIHKYSKDDVIGSKSKAGLLYEHVSNRRIVKNIVLDIDFKKKESILEQVQSNSIVIDNSYASGIGYGTSIKKDIGKHIIEATVEWEKTGTDDFGMLLYKFAPPKDLREIFRDNAKIEFELKTNGNIKSVTLEIKKPGLVKIVDTHLEVQSNEYEFHSVLLKEHNNNVDDFAKVEEICFVLREPQFVNSKEPAVFEVSGLRIVYDKVEE